MSEQTTFEATLPRGPLTRHLSGLHALFAHLGAKGDVLAVAEHHLREVAAYTRSGPAREPAESASLPVRVEALAAKWEAIHNQIAPVLGKPPQGQVQRFAEELRGLLTTPAERLFNPVTRPNPAAVPSATAHDTERHDRD